MTMPLVSVVIETVTAREDDSAGSLADKIAGTMAALDRQTYPRDSIERIVVVDGEVPEDEKAEIAGRYAPVRLEASPQHNYFAAKNDGGRSATGAFVALLDGDCIPAPDWLSALMARMQDGVAAVTGRTRYEKKGWVERIFSVPAFANIVDAGDGEASGIMLNNVVFRREVLLAYPLDSHIPRYGGCFLLYHQLRAAGQAVVYQHAAEVAHASDVANLGFIRKHFGRGYESVTIYGVDEPPVLKGTRLFRRFGRPVLIGFAARRMFLDLSRLIRHRRQMGIAVPAVPFYWLVWVGLRLVELCGAFSAASAARRGRGFATRVQQRSA